ncbi:uncharacterized protein [Eurosta solidaginis]|uniref:uncharacterized protein n=1 Tax=Eurosta solidaginis TaxID=178769 RepID=UPI0035306CB8
MQIIGESHRNGNESRRGRGRPKIIHTGQVGRPKKEYQMLNYLPYGEDVDTPRSVKEALSSEYSFEWKKSMEEEYSALLANNTWSAVDLPDGQKAIGSKWVFRIKRDSDGNIQKFKSRLVAKGCSQQLGLNYWETFSPVIRYETIRMLLAIAVEKELHLHQIDISNAYLNSKLTEEIYLKQSEEFVDNNNPNKVLKLNKAIYGLKQSGRHWNSTLDVALKDMGFSPCKSEPCLYVKQYNGSYSYIAVYVDDLILACPSEKEIASIKKSLSSKFQLHDSGAMTFFLGFEIERQGKTGAISVCQKNYINELLSMYGVTSCRPVSTPLDPGFQVSCRNDKCTKIDATSYQSLIGSLMYLAISTRPDIMHAVSLLAQRNQEPHTEHEAGAKHVLRYLITLEKIMNSTVHNTEASSIALRLLNTSKEEVNWIKLHHWTSNLLKLYETCTESHIAHQVIAAVGFLANLSNSSQESRRQFGTHHITNILNVISNEYSVNVDKLVVLQCILILLELYPEYCIRAEGVVSTFLTNLVDSQKHDIVELSAKCYHLLLNIYIFRTRKMQLKNLWKIYQEKLTEDVQILLHNLLGLFPSAVIEAAQCGPLSIPILLIGDDPVKRLAKIFIRLRNFAIYLIVTIREPLPAEKLINPNKIMSFIKNSLEALSRASENKTSNRIILTLLFPQLYYILLQVLEALITTIGTDLRRNYKEVWTIMAKMLNSSSGERSMEEKQSYMRVRIKLCDVIALWCKITGQGSRSDLMHSFVINALTNTSSIYTFSKTAYGKYGFGKNVADKTVQEVVSATQSCLYQMFLSSPNHVKPQAAKAIEATTFNMFTTFLDASLDNNIKNGHKHDFLHVIFAMLKTRNFFSPSCAEAFINIAREIYLEDQRSKMRYNNALILLNLENYIHPQKDCLKYQMEVNRTHNIFLESFDWKNTKCSDEAGMEMGNVPDMTTETDIGNLPPANQFADIEESSLFKSKSSRKCSEDVIQLNSNDEKLIANIITTFVDDLS